MAVSVVRAVPAVVSLLTLQPELQESPGQRVLLADWRFLFLLQFQLLITARLPVEAEAVEAVPALMLTLVDAMLDL